MEKGKIIYLEGVSGAGKTTLARTLQTRLPEPFFLLAGAKPGFVTYANFKTAIVKPLGQGENI